MSNFIVEIGGSGVSPFETAKVFKMAKNAVFINGISKISFKGGISALSKEERRYLEELPISKTYNISDEEVEQGTEIKGSSPQVIGDRYRVIRKFDLLFVDFGEQPFGFEFGGKHPALCVEVFDKTSLDKHVVRVVPLTSRYHKGDSVLQMVLTPENLNASSSFFESSNGRVSYFKFKDIRTIDKRRVLWKIGYFSKDMYPVFEEYLVKSIVDSKVKGLPFSVDNSIQTKMLESIEDMEKIRVIAKNYSLSYETKVQNLMKVFSFYNYEEGEFLSRFIKSSRGKNYIPYDDLINDIALEEKKNPQAIRLKIEEYVTKGFRGLEERPKTLVIEFCKLINKLAGGTI